MSGSHRLIENRRRVADDETPDTGFVVMTRFAQRLTTFDRRQGSATE